VKQCNLVASDDGVATVYKPTGGVNRLTEATLERFGDKWTGAMATESGRLALSIGVSMRLVLRLISQNQSNQESKVLCGYGRFFEFGHNTHMNNTTSKCGKGRLDWVRISSYWSVEKGSYTVKDLAMIHTIKSIGSCYMRVCVVSVTNAKWQRTSTMSRVLSWCDRVIINNNNERAIYS